MGMQLDAFSVSFDAGHEVTVTLKSRDIAKAERLGVKLDDNNPVIGAYALAFIALQRMFRNGEIDFVLPGSAEALEDCADLEYVEDPDARGEDSTRAPATG